MNSEPRLYRHLLAAVELDDSGKPLLQRALTLARQFDARLSVLHVVEYLPVESGDLLAATPVNLTQEMSAQASQRLQQLCADVGLPAESGQVRCGLVAGEILAQARELHADLLLVGHLPRRGLLARLFSHTEEDVVARAPCDVLALRLA